ncbi:hypothetical protein SAMN05444274_10561 [Mariniphaga anaerophila]|uniref:Uncharacterized protein n=1 Tax=Mariniphaga anaerophila TaxID=1484053 RepID=A0A1M5BAD6_9BACT|nr:hypothetical protein SAMN05444274_10561 [Mariniphaga anaerophila]
MLQQFLSIEFLSPVLSLLSLFGFVMEEFL